MKSLRLRSRVIRFTETSGVKYIIIIILRSERIVRSRALQYELHCPISMVSVENHTPLPGNRAQR